MSVSAKLNRAGIVVAVAAVALMATGVVVGTVDSGPSGRTTIDDARTPATTLRTPDRSLDVIASATPAQSAIAVSQRLYARSRVAVLTAADPADQALAATAGTTLGVPVLLDDPGVAAELERLGASTVVTFGATTQVPGRLAVTAGDAEHEVNRLRTTYDLGEQRRTLDAIVVTRSVKANAAAVATAQGAGAKILELPDADPRRVPDAAKILAADPGAPVIALGTPFTKGFAYTLGAVRSGATQIGGGYLALPGRHYTAMYGHPDSAALGVLGEQGVAASVARVNRLAAKYRAVTTGTIVPTFEIIATVASAGPGKDKNYSRETSIAKLKPLIDAAGKAGIYVIIDLQPGRSSFLTQAKRYESLLRLPHVGLALDPEWRLKKDQVHLRQIGSVGAKEINQVADWLATVTRENTLPQKLFVLHQFSTSMIKHRSRLDTTHPELATVIHVDGQGSQAAKKGTWNHLRKGAPAGVFWGWKNFVDEDRPMLNVPKTWSKVKPHPALITYQ